MESGKPEEGKKTHLKVVPIRRGAEETEAEQLDDTVEALALYVEKCVHELFFSSKLKDEFFDKGNISMKLDGGPEMFEDGPAGDASTAAAVKALIEYSAEEMRSKTNKPNAQIDNIDAFIYGVEKHIRILLGEVELPFDLEDDVYFSVEIESPEFMLKKTTPLSRIPGLPAAK